jgi:signal transduction histidine kinase
MIRAFKSVEEGGELNVVASTAGNQIKIAISDSGEPICRSGKELGLRSGKDGFGHDIDLSICYNIIQHHNGLIKMNTEAEAGNKVAVYFPASI